jgi:membrane-bound lytic murein transglycosylase A
MAVAFRRAVAAACLAALALTTVATPAPLPGGSRATGLLSILDADVPTLADDGDPESLRHAIRQSLTWLARQPSGQRVGFGPRSVTVAEQAQFLRRVLDMLADDPSPEVLADRVLSASEVLKSAGSDDGAMLVTGYHEPIIDASERPSAEYPVPILGVPRNLGTARRAPFLTRAEIEQGRLGPFARPLAWARDSIDAFFMEIEGSGTLRLPGGRELRVGYAETNRRPYRSIAKLLIDEGRIPREAMSMRVLRQWLAEHPEERERVLRHNESYVFFRVLSGTPVGSLGVLLTPGRSIATDPGVFPRGALAFVRTMRPVELPDGLIAWKPSTRFVLNQDAGGAIRGPGRVDIFWGRGPEAELAASDMKEPGELYFLAPRTQGSTTRVVRTRCCELAPLPEAAGRADDAPIIRAAPPDEFPAAP